jgi:hypothetical protein
MRRGCPTQERVETDGIASDAFLETLSMSFSGSLHKENTGLMFIPVMIPNLAGFARLFALVALLWAPLSLDAQAARVTATVERSLGASTHPDSLLQLVSDVAIGPAGQVIVLDGLARNLKVFESSGVLRRIIGRRGEGPGEFSSPLRVEVTRDGRIFVFEAGRIQSFSLDGTLLGSVKTSPVGEVPVGYAVSDDGVFYQATSMFTTALNLNPSRDSAAIAARMSSARGARTNSIDSLIRVRSWKPNGDSVTTFLSTASPPMDVNQMAIPLWSRNSSGNMVVSSGARPTFRFYSAEGRFMRAIPAPSSWRATPITPADLDVLIAKYSESLPAASRDIVISQLRRRGMGAEYPAYVAIALTDDESIWVRPPVTAADIRAGRVTTFDLRQNMGLAEWHVLSSSGAFRMRVSVPAGFQLRRVVGDRLYGHALGANDEPLVQILRVPAQR